MSHAPTLRHFLQGSLAFAVLTLSIARVEAQRRYAVTDLGTLGGSYSYAFGVNSAGQVVGYSETLLSSPFDPHAFLWESETGLQDLGTLGGRTSFAYGINSLGQIVGESVTSAGETHAFLWTPEATDGVPTNPQMKDLGVLEKGASVARGVNDRGQVVGYSGLLYAYHAFLLDSESGMSELLPDGVAGGAASINGLGQVAGARDTVGTYTEAFLWDDRLGPRGLGAIGGDSPFSRANALNDNGQVVGSSSTSTRSHAFLWDGESGMQDLGTLPDGAFSEAYGINNAGEIVGTSITLGEVQSAVFWDIAGPRNLNDLLVPDSDWRLQEARAISDAGLIVGYGYHDGAGRAFLLRPQ